MLSDNVGVGVDGRHQIIRPTPRRAIDISPTDNLRFVQVLFSFLTFVFGRKFLIGFEWKMWFIVLTWSASPLSSDIAAINYDSFEKNSRQDTKFKLIENDQIA